MIAAKTIARATLLLAPVLTTSTAIGVERLNPPFNVEERRAIMGKITDRYVCKPPPPSVHDINVNPFYSDRDGSVVDPAAYARHQESMKPVTEYTEALTAISDAYLRSKPANPAIAECAVDWLYAWARDDAMLGTVTRQGGYERKWSLVTIALAYLKVRNGESPDLVKKQRIEKWIREMAGAVRSYYQTGKGTDTRNNHAYWAALAVMASGVVLNYQEFFGWGIDRYRLALSQIQADGTLPLEVARKSKALHYHVFSLMPLVLIAEIGARNGLALYDEADGALHRLAGRVIEGLDDPSYFERLTGERQQWIGGFGGHSLVWAEPYYARFGDLRLVKLIARHRPLRHRWFGGDATLTYGVKDLPKSK